MRNTNQALSMYENSLYENSLVSAMSVEKARMEIAKARLLLACPRPMLANSYDSNDADFSTNPDSDNA
ncbi:MULTISPECIES: hypothetical protein [unclassified Methylophilus]|jgi:hypothetical protein|uniref:hypothetical protein n=1 Tax=unclassified Methylophilus TaxID=2630143 RepID=UPI0006FC78A4|nr:MULTISPECIES: hypothetical protein [unclassified Methylophilus]KQT43850.1 hypothetical protein ASG34_03500 [Methylophilus sp. Leaf416]KQT59334.1 hypothetical protein ASG44_03505 [Methylophilus sp. Leaf459]